MVTRTSKQSLGESGENLACKYLEGKNYIILDRNYTIYGGEMDIVAKKDGRIIFVEVRTRKNDDFAHPLETLSPKKRLSLKKTLFLYAQKHGIDIDDCQFDVIGIILKANNSGYTLTHLRGVEI